MNKEYLKLAGLCVFNAALITGLEYLHKKKSKNVSYKTFKVEVSPHRSKMD